MTPSGIEPATFRLVAVPQPTTPKRARQRIIFTRARTTHLHSITLFWNSNKSVTGNKHTAVWVPRCVVTGDVKNQSRESTTEVNFQFRSLKQLWALDARLDVDGLKRRGLSKTTQRSVIRSSLAERLTKTLEASLEALTLTTINGPGDLASGFRHEQEDSSLLRNVWYSGGSLSPILNGYRELLARGNGRSREVLRLLQYSADIRNGGWGWDIRVLGVFVFA